MRPEINRAIKHTGLRVYAARNGNRYLGYAYFVDGAGNQVGESVPVYRLAHLTLDQWVAEAEKAAQNGPVIESDMARDDQAVLRAFNALVDDNTGQETVHLRDGRVLLLSWQ